LFAGFRAAFTCWLRGLRILLETEKTLAFLDVYPLSRGHALVIPKTHAEKVHELSPDTMADLGPVLAKVAKALNVPDYNILQNNGRLAHQEVKHVHFHIIPKPNEKEGLGIDWPSKKVEPDELKPLLEEIRNRL